MKLTPETTGYLPAVVPAYGRAVAQQTARPQQTVNTAVTATHGTVRTRPSSVTDSFSRNARAADRYSSFTPYGDSRQRNHGSPEPRIQGDEEQSAFVQFQPHAPNQAFNEFMRFIRTIKSNQGMMVDLYA